MHLGRNPQVDIVELSTEGETDCRAFVSTGVVSERIRTISCEVFALIIPDNTGNRGI